jgi:hypothetical protein
LIGISSRPSREFSLTSAGTKKSGQVTGPSCDVDSLIRRGTKTRSGHSGYIHFSVDIEQCRYLLYICVQNTQIQMRVFLS